MKKLSMDVETYSGADLARSGVYRYAEEKDFEILLFGYAADDGEVQVIDLAGGEKMPGEILAALEDDRVIKTAYNANFERVCLSRYLRDLGKLAEGQFLSPEAWRCTMVWAAYLGLPRSLADVGEALGLEKQKLASGQDLIRYFCCGCTPTLMNGGRTRNLPGDDPERWKKFKAYNRRDVETEMAIQRRLARYPVPEKVWAEYRLDQEINDRGILLDRKLVNAAERMGACSEEAIGERLKRMTGLENPSSPAQMKKWLGDHGIAADSLGKKEAAGLMKEMKEPYREALTLYQQLNRSSVKKYDTMQEVVCQDGRARGMFLFYGANRTGRFSGRLIQLQNLPQNHLENLEEAREMVLKGDYEAVKARYGDVPDLLSQLVRTAIVAPEGKVLAVADFSAIEARVIAWLAGERWRMELFQAGGDIYCGSAEKMFGVPVEKNGVNGHLRQKGKIAELALGYGGAEKALLAMGALEMGLTEAELLPLVEAWREANPHIVQLWRDVNDAAIKAVWTKSSAETHGIRITCGGGMMFITLPSGRSLSYVEPSIGTNRFGGKSVTHLGIGENKRWKRIETYGAKLCENIVQGIARDLLCEAMKRLKAFDIVAHVHDEIIVEAPTELSIDSLCEQMSRTPEWADGLVLNAEGFLTPFYRK